MRTFTIKYTDRGRAATVTVQGNEIATMDERLCIRHDGMSIATFPKDDVLHVTSHGDNDDWPAPADDELELASSRPADRRPRLDAGEPETAADPPVAARDRRASEPPGRQRNPAPWQPPEIDQVCAPTIGRRRLATC